MLSREAILDHLPRLRRYARALTGDRFAADDLVQDTVERALSRCLYRLSEEQRAVLLLVCVEELNYAQCARVLAIPVGTVMSRLTRARQKLARLLAGDEEVVVKLEVVK